MMEKSLVNSHQLNGGSLENAKAKHKYQSLLEDHLNLQKEYVSKKRKLQAIKKRKEILLDEVRFLRQRYRQLTKLKFAQVETEDDLKENDADIHEKSNKKCRTDVEEEQEDDRRDEVAIKTSDTENKKLKSCLMINRSKSVKKKVTWQDQVALSSEI